MSTLSEYEALQGLLSLQSPRRGTNTEADKSSEATTPPSEASLSPVNVPNDQGTSNSTQKVDKEVKTQNPVPIVPTSSGTSSDEPSQAATSQQTLKRKSPEHESPSNIRDSTQPEEKTSKRTKLFKKSLKPMKHCPVAPTPTSDTGNNSEISANEPIEQKPDIIIIRANGKLRKVETRDVGTQTENDLDKIKMELMEKTISKLNDTIKTMAEELHYAKNKGKALTIVIDIPNNNGKPDDKIEESNVDDMILDEDCEQDESYETVADYERDSEPKNKAGPHRAGHKSTKILSNRNINTNSNDMIPIGDGNTMIPARIFRHINWNSYTSATRKLLTAVFSRKVLATHSLTGKSSPAFPNKPPKKRLDANIINDIVQTVVDRCSVPENVVRTSITTKCADESKMFRTRQQNKKKRRPKINRENIPPDSDSD